MALGAGSIAFTGFNLDGSGNLAFVTLENLAAGTTINFTNNWWNGSALEEADWTGTWTWTASTDIAAGTTIAINDLVSANTTTSAGAVTTADIGEAPLWGGFYAYVGSSTAPAFLAAVSASQFATDGLPLGGTGLQYGVTAVDLKSQWGPDIGIFNGAHLNATDFADFLPSINNANNWLAQNGDLDGADQGNDGEAPDLPLPTDPFEIDPAAQKVAFAAGSLTVTQVEGDSGTTVLTFIVERTNGTSGAVEFSGVIGAGTTNDADFGGAIPTTFSGTIADGATSAVVTITIAGERLYEADENFTLTLKNATNAGGAVYVSTSPAETTATGVIVNDDTVQSIAFAADSVTVNVIEGNDGTRTFTFTVERTGSGGTEGDVTFSGTFSASGTNAGDYGGTLPSSTFSGTIPAGATSTTVTITIAGETVIENNESFTLRLTSATNPAADTVVLGSATTATGVIVNDDGPTVIHAGQTYTQTIGLGGTATLTIEQGGTLATSSGNQIRLDGTDMDVTINNAGTIGTRAVFTGTPAGNLVLNNEVTGVISGQVEIGNWGPSEVTINNAGLITAGNKTIRGESATMAVHTTINNLATGVIVSANENSSAMSLDGRIDINNAGKIMVPVTPGRTSAGSDAINYTHGTGTMHNLAGGWIEGSGHALTGEAGLTVINDAGATMIGRNGSAVNIDNDATVENTVTVINRGLMQAQSQNYADSDGDAVDVDGRVNVENWGTIEGLGHNGYHNGEPNVSEGIAAGAANIVNHEGGKIYGYGRAIQIDNSGNADAFAPTTINNAGLIQGDGHLPTDVTPEEVAEFDALIRGGEAINIVGSYADSLTNTGRIIGGVKMGGGDDIIVNKGMMTATGGSAANLGDGNDTFEFHVGSTVTGLIDGGEGDDTLKLIGAGMGSVGANANFEKLDVQSGMWSVQSDAYDVINVATGATVTSQLKLAAEGEMNVAMGGIVLVTNGSDAVVTEGVADIENAGLIQGLGMQGAAMAKAIVTNGGTVHNKAGGTILAMGTAIASGAAPAAGVDIVNEGMIQSMSGQAIVLGGQDDSVTNKGMIMGSVDLGAGNDTLNIHTGSSISGTVTGGEGDDTVRLVGTTPAAVSSFNSTSVSSFEKLAVAEGIWSVTGGDYSAITVEDGATLTSAVALNNNDHLTVDAGGKLTGAISRSGNGNVVVDNSGLIEVSGRVLNGGSSSGTLTINNLAGAIIKQIGSDTDVIRPGQNGTVNNWGTITTAEGFAGGGDLIDFQGNTGGAVNNKAGGYMEGSRHVVTGDHAVTVVNDGTMIGRNGSAVNIDNGGSEADKVFVTNRGTMEGRSAGLSDSDGDAVDIDGLAQILNYGRIAGMGANGRHDGEPNVSEGIAIGGGSVVNNAGAEIYGYGRAIQVDNSSNSNALGATTIVNDGLIQGDGHGPEGVTYQSPEEAAKFDLRGNEAINLIGDYEDYIINNAGGRIVGGISTGGARDTLNNSGSIRATGGSAINMGAGNDQVNLYVGATVVGAILLGLGDDVALSTSSAGFEIDGGEGNDSIFMDSTYSGDDNLKGGAGDDYVYGGAGNDVIDGGDGNDTLKGESGNDVVDGGAGNDIILAGAGDTIKGGTGDDVVEVSKWDGIPGSIDGGEGNDTLKLTGDTTATSFNSSGVTNVENLVVTEGTWSVTGGDYSSFTIENGATLTSAITLNNNDHLTIEAGGKLTGAITHSGSGNVVIDNSGQIALSGRIVNGSSTGSLVLNNLAGATIQQTGNDTDVIRPGQNGTINNWGTIKTADGFAGGGDLIDFQSSTGGKVNNYTGGYMEGSRHVVTGDNAVTVVNDGTMIGRNGSAVNIDNGGSEEEKVFITNRGTMEGRSATLSDSDGDAVDVDGLVQVLNYGRIAGMGANGRHDGEPNVSEGIAIGGGSILNYGANAEIYGYGRAIQVDNSSNSNALGKTFINNEGLIKGDGHGPEGVTYQSPEEAAKFDLRGNEAINLVGDYDDEILNQSTGRIVGGVSMGGGNDHLQSLGSFVATGGSAIDMGAGNDTVYFYTGTTVQGSVLLGTGDDLLLSTAAGGFVIDAGAGNDQIYLDSNYSGNDVLSGGAGDDYLYAGAGNDQINGGDGNDMLSGENGDDVVDGGAGDDTIMGGAGADTLRGGDGNDTIKAGAGDIVEGGAGDDIVEVSTWDGTPASIDGGEGDDTLKLAGPGTGSLGATTNVENLLVQEGTWSVAASDYASITIKNGATVTSTLTLNNDDTLTIENGGKLATATAINWTGGGDVVVDNAGRIEASSRVLNTTAGVTGSLTFNNEGTVVGALTPQGAGHADAVITINNSGTIESAVNGRVIDFRNFDANGASAIINNLAGGIIHKIGGDDADVIRPGVDGVVNNWGTITVDVAGVDAIDFQSDAGGKVNNYAGGLIQGTKHAVTGEKSVTVVNSGLMVGLNGSAVNIDNDGTEAEKVFITNNASGIMEGRSAETSDSDGDAIDVDGLAQILNYGRIAGMGAEGYHDGEPNVSEGIAIGGGTILNYGANAEIYGYGRAIQVDNSSNSNALGKTFVNNEGLIQGDGHGPEGVDPEDAAQFDLRGNEAINLVGDYDDEILNQSTGRIVGGVSMGGGSDRLSNSGSIVATGGSAIDMGAGDDWLWLYNGPNSKVEGKILLGTGNDLVFGTARGGFDIDAGDGNDEIYMDSTVSGDDTIAGGAGDDRVYAGAGEDRIDGGAGNDSLHGEAGDDLILGGAGNDTIDGGNDDDVIYGDDGHDTIIGGLGNDTIKGGAGDDIFVIQATGDGRDSYDGGAGIDTLDYSALNTAVNLTLKDGATTYQTDTIENVENIIGGSAADKLTGNALDNVLTGNAGDDTLNGGGGNDTLNGGEGIDTLNGGDGNDQLFGGTGDDVLKGAAGDDHLEGGDGADDLDGGAGNDTLLGGANDDVLKGAAGNDHLEGGNGNDDLDGGADNDTLLGGAGDDIVKGGAGNDVITGGAGNDTLTGGAGNDVFVFKSVSDGIDTITDFKTSGASEDHIALSTSMFQNFSGDDAFDLIGSGFLRAVSCDGTTKIQVDVDGGGDNFVTLATVTGNISNGVLADHILIQQDQIA